MINLRKVIEDNFDECIKLEPKEEQKGYVASNIYSLAENIVAKKLYASLGFKETGNIEEDEMVAKLDL